MSDSGEQIYTGNIEDPREAFRARTWEPEVYSSAKDPNAFTASQAAEMGIAWDQQSGGWVAVTPGPAETAPGQATSFATTYNGATVRGSFELNVATGHPLGDILELDRVLQLLHGRQMPLPDMTSYTMEATPASVAETPLALTAGHDATPQVDPALPLTGSIAEPAPAKASTLPSAWDRAADTETRPYQPDTAVTPATSGKKHNRRANRKPLSGGAKLGIVALNGLVVLGAWAGGFSHTAGHMPGPLDVMHSAFDNAGSVVNMVTLGKL